MNKDDHNIIDKLVIQTYQKRVGFVISYQSLIPHGGIGQFAKSFVEMMFANNIKVDIIVDKKPNENDFIKTLRNLGANIIWPQNSLSYATHSSIFMYEDTFCYERMINFRNSIIEALSKNLYDAIICNTYESIQVASTMGLDEYIQIIAYTHLESQIFKQTNTPFFHSVNEMMLKQMAMSNITIGTQSKFNQLQFDNNAYLLPIPFPEKGLLKKYNKPREGVLFVGRWEAGKNPELYLELIEKTRLPARVMTNAKGTKKFEEALSKLGVDYKIAVSIIGQEKVDFITSCRVAFNPSLVESFGIAFLEQQVQMPTVALQDQRWTNNFNKENFFECTRHNMVDVVMELYNRYPTANHWYNIGVIDKIKAHDDIIFHKWNECLLDFKPRTSNSNSAKICNEQTIKVSEFIKGLGRTTICIDDLKSIFGNKHKFRIIYTDTDTYFTKDPNFTPENQQLVSNLFDDL
jgi:glycosyltransferase involved in cell wall biosynthesis